jgi:plasmid stabilization system protein ParE
VTHTVHFTPEARDQLDKLEVDISGAASPAVAARYVDSIVDHCEKLQTFPQRGTRRDDLRPGLRTLGFRRRVTILFEVADDTVNIIGVYYGGQDYEAALREGDLTEIEHDDDEP